MAKPKPKANSKQQLLSLLWHRMPFAVGVVAFLAYMWLYQQQQQHQHQLLIEHDDDQTRVIAEFEDWFVQQGGWMTPRVSLVTSNQYQGNGLRTSGNIIQGYRLLEIPMELVLTQKTIMVTTQKYAALLRPQSYKIANEAIQRHLFDPLDQQDVWIAIQLMLECAKGDTSLWYPYRNVLPTSTSNNNNNNSVPRLATFSDAELQLLQDDDMANYGKFQRDALTKVWNGVIKSEVIQPSSADDADNNNDCLTEESFYHHVGLSASRAMILDEIKYLVPMAEMINHANRPREDDDYETTKFQSYHKIENGKLMVYADRDFFPGDEVVEEYGKLDNTLYLTSFGFIPKDNVHHCVMLPLPNNNNNKASSSVCIHRDGSALGDDNQQLRMSVCTSTKEECAARRNHNNTPEREAREVQVYLRQAAHAKLAASQTTVQEDEALLAELEQQSTKDDDNWRGMNRNRARLALQFRTEEKKLLMHLTEK